MSIELPILETSLTGITRHRRGKVRDMYEVGDDLLMIATDRISAYDYVLGSAIPDKGKVLTQLSKFWFSRTQHIVPNHMISTEPSTYPASLQTDAKMLEGRSMLVRRTQPIPIECVARGYLTGSGWQEYTKTGKVCGIVLPSGLRESERLPEPIFTPATKAESGHDINISENEAAELIGRKLVDELHELTLSLYKHGAVWAEKRGIIVADTKFEFGQVGNKDSDDILLIDEVLTPDSSRFWPSSDYAPGRAQSSFDKQYVRDYLDSIKWNRKPPVPELPSEVIEGTRQKYTEAFELLAEKKLT